MKNKFFGIFIFLILSIIIVYKFNYVSLCLLIIIILFLLKNKQYKLIIIYLSFTIFIMLTNDIDNKNNTCSFGSTFKVVEVHDKYCIIKQASSKYLLYQEKNELKEGNIILLDGTLEEIPPNGIPYLFSFKDYLDNKNIYYQINYKNLKIIDNNETFQSKIKNSLLSNIEYSYNYINLLIFNSKSDNIIDFYNDLIKISAIQLFVISGFHISFLYNFLNKLIKIITKKDDNILNYFIIFYYIYLLNFSLSSFRAFLSLLLNKFNKKFKISLSNLDINSLIGIIFLIINPKNLFLVGFQLSFFVVTFLSIIGNIKNKYNSVLILFIPFLVSLPFIVNMNNNIGIINIFMNYLLTPIVSIIYLLGIITIIFPFLDLYLFYIIFGFENIVNLLSDINIYINIPYLKLSYIILYYLLIYFLLLNIYLKRKKKSMKSLLLIIMFMITWINKPISEPFIIFLDVGQGDSCLIHGKNNEYNILIDTGGSIYNDIANKKLIPYFHKEGIKKLDLVLISHLDYDHYGALESLNNNFKIDRIIKDNNYENIYFKDINFINLNNYYDEKEEDENIKSSVLLFEFIGLTFLLTGDAPISIEEKIIKDYQIDIDVLKVGHHGSNTSSSKEFINKIKPELAIISVGRNNRYGHPHNEVLKILKEEKVLVLRTDKVGSIKINKNIFNENIIKTKL